MTRYTKNHRTSSARKPLTIAAASVLTVGALAGAGVAGANAATPMTHAVSSAVQAGTQQAGLLHDVRTAFAGTTADGGAQGSASTSVDGAKAKDVASRLVGNQELFSKLPAALQTDLKALAGASSPQDASTRAEQIKTTALNGGYGDQARKMAGHLFGHGQNPAEAAGKSLLPDLKAAAGQGQQAGESAQRLAQKAVSDQGLFAHLPANLKTDLTSLAGASGADVSAQAEKVKSTALDGGYGQQIQQLAQHLQTMATTAAPGGASGQAGAGTTSS